MTSSAESLSEALSRPSLAESRPDSSLRRQVFGFLVTLFFLTGNLLLTQPLLEKLGRSEWVGPTYLIIRVLAILLYSLWLALWVGKSKGGIFRAVTFLGFLDQVVLKLLAILVHRQLDPNSWLIGPGAESTHLSGGSSAAMTEFGFGSLFLGLMMSYVLFVPFLVLATYLVSEMGEALARRSRANLK
jgi:hypothetical protein